MNIDKIFSNGFAKINQIFSEYLHGVFAINQTIVFTRNLMKQNPPKPDSVIHFTYKQSNGNPYTIGQLPAGEKLIEDFTKYKETIIRKSVMEIIDAMEYFIKELADFIRIWVKNNDEKQEVFQKIEKRNHDNPEQALKSIRDVFDDLESFVEYSNAKQLPTQLRHLWVHRSNLIDERFMHSIGFHGGIHTITWLNFPRKIQIGIDFFLEQSDPRELGLYFIDS